MGYDKGTMKQLVHTVQRSLLRNHKVTRFLCVRFAQVADEMGTDEARACAALVYPFIAGRIEFQGAVEIYLSRKGIEMDARQFRLKLLRDIRKHFGV